MDLKDIVVGQIATFRTMKMDAFKPDHSGVVVAHLDSLRGSWVEIETPDGGKYRTRPALVKTCVPKPKTKKAS